MSIHRLDESTARNLFSTQLIPNFEAAVYAVALNSVQHGATQVVITILPAALRFTVVDNGPGFSPADWSLALKPGCTSLKDGRGESLAALAAVSTVELHSRRKGFLAAKLVRTGEELTSTSSHDTSASECHSELRNNDGTVVDVWELFQAFPVRRRAEIMRDDNEVVDAVRDLIVALSLANPRVKLSLQGGNGLVFYNVDGRHGLSVDMIQTGFGSITDLDWCRISGKAGPLSVTGFIARRGSSSSTICLVSFDGTPVHDKGWLHRTARRAWKTFISGRIPDSGAWNRYPCYVLNVKAHGKPSKRLWTAEMFARRLAPLERNENGFFSVIQAALMGETTIRRSTSKKLELQTSIALPSTRKRKPLTVEERFSEALIYEKLNRPESSHFASKRARVALVRPASAPSTSQVQRHFHGAARSGRAFLRRPVSAQRVETAYRRQLPNWSNPCFHVHAAPIRNAFSKDENGYDDCHALFEKRSVTVARDAIPSLKIVGQVDRKFIVVVDNNSTMYAIDQHAASERYMYEHLLKKIAKNRPTSRDISSLGSVQLSHKQLVASRTYADELSGWGWCLKHEHGSTVLLESAPHLDDLKVTLDNADDLRVHLDSLAQGASKSSMPKPIMNAVARAACHTAVRFGDELSTAQCQSLVTSLAECESPFTCAHGRPSIVPLAVFEKASGLRTVL